MDVQELMSKVAPEPYGRPCVRGPPTKKDGVMLIPVRWSPAEEGAARSERSRRATTMRAQPAAVAPDPQAVDRLGGGSAAWYCQSAATW